MNALQERSANKYFKFLAKKVSDNQINVSFQFKVSNEGMRGKRGGEGGAYPMVETKCTLLPHDDDDEDNQ